MGQKKLHPAGLDAIAEDLNAAFRDVRAEVTADFTVGISARAERALAHLETFSAIALRIMRNTNPSKIKDAAMVEEIRARINGREVFGE